MKWFSSDWHIGHKNVLKYSDRPFECIEDMNEIIIDNMMSPLKKGDIFYYLGDIGYGKEAYWMINNRIPRGVQFFWIPGNHDKKLTHFTKNNNNKIQIAPPIMDIALKGNKVTLCHYPMLTWNQSHRNAWQLFGHHHINGHGSDQLDNFTKGKQLNVCCEFHDYNPLSEERIVALMQQKGDNWDFIPRN